jgi:hypothetical protein
MTPEIIEAESADEKNYREISSRLTALDCEIETARENLALYAFQNPLRTSAVRARLEQLQGELEERQRQRQRLLPVWSELKSRVNGW